jgi:uncharacterized protein with GYD domain
MPTFIMFGRYSSEGVREISADRTVWAFNLVREMGGKVKDMYALLGEYDLVFIVDLPGIPEAIKASVALSKQTGITFTTSPAITAEEFDKLVT